jgi:hypothetical protein
LNLYSFDYEDQLRKKNEEDRVAKEIQQEAADEEQFAQQLESNALGGGGAPTPQDALSQARDIATQLYPLDGAQRRAKLQEIKATDQALYASVKAQLEQMTSEARSSGLASSKQQATQPQ